MSVEVDDVELYESVLEYLRAQESKLPSLTYRSPHLTNGDRSLIIEWMYHVGIELRISNSAQHLATALFDYFIDCHQSDKLGLYLIGLSCISIASKVEDIEINIPRSSKLITLIPLEQKPDIGFVKSTELKILQHFDWMIHLPTEASFIDYYSASCLAMELESFDDPHYKATLTRYYNKWISYFREKTLLLDNMRSHRPSLVACAIVASSRIALVMQPEWPKGMIKLTRIQRNEFDSVLHMLLSCLEEDLTMEHDNQAPKVTTPKSEATNLISQNQGDVTNAIAYQLSSMNFHSPRYHHTEASFVPEQNTMHTSNLHHLQQAGSAPPVSMAGDQSWAQNFNPMIHQPLRRSVNPVRDAGGHLQPVVPPRECYQHCQANSFQYPVRHSHSANNLPHPLEDCCVPGIYNQSNAAMLQNIKYYQNSLPVTNHAHLNPMLHYNHHPTSNSQFSNSSGHYASHYHPQQIANMSQQHCAHLLTHPSHPNPNYQVTTRRQAQNLPEFNIRKSRLNN